ncbi:hypothetical protein [Kutzneria sp. NPDC051319]|uniref:hypothetical protein n=1 Tax=Kutzneria sp. NPDC051319 TaxID=3155047 RepID=UPI0034394E87
MSTTPVGMPDPDDQHFDNVRVLPVRADRNTAAPCAVCETPQATCDQLQQLHDGVHCCGTCDHGVTAVQDTPDPAVVVEDGHFDVELDAEPTEGGAVVDTRGGAVVVAGKETRRPVIPSSLHGWANIRSTARHQLDRAAYIAAYHAVRSPIYGAKTSWWATVGLGRLAGRQLRWWWVSEQHTLRQNTAAADDPAGWMQLHREVRTVRFWRGGVLLAEVAGLAVVLPTAWAHLPGWVCAAGIAAAATGLARLGRPADRPIVAKALVSGRHRRINADIVLRAYYAAGLGHPDKPAQKISFGSVMARDGSGTGSRVVIDLPYGKGFDDVMKAKSAIASGLDVSINQVFLTPDDSSHRRHCLFVTDQDPLSIPAGRSPLIDGKQRDIWNAAPFGLDERGRPVRLDLMWISVLVGAQPRKGKTFSARALALFAALDPYVRMTVVDGKNSPDWDKFKLVAHRMVFGTVANNRDTDPVEHLLEALREIERHIQGVNEFLAALPVTECPEGKLTRELSHKYPQLRVWMLVMEEFQVYFELDDQDTNKEVARLLSYIMAVGPSAGVILLSSSQKPSGVGAGDVSRLFNRYRDNHAVRFALKCGNRNVSEAVLGGDAYAEGYDASALPTGTRYRGVGILYGATDETPVVRTYLADHADAEKILLAARKHRLALGTLTGHAAGEDLDREVRDVLADARSVVNAGEKGLHWDEMAERLADRMPEHYADVTGEAISAQLRALRVQSVNINRGGAVRKGCKTEHLDAVLAARAAGEK